ncbi:MAG: hypothetical protein H6737_11805 [Alphaproteobacteria bacterium]|nr:hypothetical protein [Alphaproteobacteria bacterium]
MVVLSLSMALAVPLVVDDDARADAIRAIADRLWHDNDLSVQTEPSADLPRIEVRDDVVYWVTDAGIVERTVDSPTTIVMLARAWSLPGEEPSLGWVPPTDPVGIDAEVEAVEAPPARRPVLSDLWFGMGVRQGLPERCAIPGLSTQVGLQRGLLLVRIATASRLRSPRSSFQNLPPGPIHQSRFGASLLAGIASPPNEALASVIVFAMVGPEVQLYATYPSGSWASWEPEDVDIASWDVGAQAAVGGEMRVRRVGFRATGAVDVRRRSPVVSTYGDFALVLHL